MQTDKVVMKTETIFSDDRKNRYLLRKEWDSRKSRATVIMTNPSTADILLMDYTTLYIMNNLVKLDFGAVEIVNMVSKTTVKLNINDTVDALSDEENFGHIQKSAEKSDKVIIAWGKLGENNKKIREIQDTLLLRLKPYREKLYLIAGENGESGFHPLAPQIRFTWVLKKYEPVEKELEKAAS